MPARPLSPTRGRRALRWTARAAAVALGLATAALTSAGGATAAVPPAPSGWTQQFADDFNGAAGTGVNTANWLYDLGTGYPGGPSGWGTGEI
jgi:hypothetical protein